MSPVLTLSEVHYDMPSSPGTVSTTEADVPLVEAGTSRGNKVRRWNKGRADPLDAISSYYASSDDDDDDDGLVNSDDELDQRRQLLTDVMIFYIYKPFGVLMG